MQAEKKRMAARPQAQQNVARCRDGANVFSQRMVMTCMGFAWPGLSSSLHGPALLLVPTAFLPGGLPCPSETHCTIPTSVLVFEGNIFTHPCFSTFYGMQISDGQHPCCLMEGRKWSGYISETIDHRNELRNCGRK